jgi:hypothetical protein
MNMGTTGAPVAMEREMGPAAAFAGIPKNVTSTPVFLCF